MKKIYIIIAACSLLFVSCVDEASQARVRIKKQLDSIDAKCPLDMDIISINGMSLEKDTIVIKYSIDNNLYPVKTMGEIYRQHKKDFNVTSFLSFFEVFNDTAQLKQDMLLTNVSMKYEVSSKTSSDCYEMFISSDEVKDYSSRTITERERNQLRIKNKLAGEAYRCPYKIDEGMWMEDVYIDGNYVTFKINMDENLYSIATLRSIPKELKAALLEEVKNLPSMMAYADLVAIDNCNLGMQYIYVGSESKKSVSVKLEPSEMPNLSTLKNNVNKEYGSKIFE